jgi:dTDP-4-dehydrorhamnose reductase
MKGVVLAGGTGRSPKKLPNASQERSWFAATQGRRLLARRIIPITTSEYGSRTPRPAYSVLSNSLLKQTFGITLPDWRRQLHQCFASRSFERML